MPFPFKPGDWVANQGDRVAKVKAVYADEKSAVLLDLVMFKWDGKKTGRESPACGGPRSFEPACNGDDWRRVKAPTFPMSPVWTPAEGGGAIARYWAGESLPPANWTPPKRRARFVPRPADDELRKALEQIANGHNDARGLAKQVLNARR